MDTVACPWSLFTLCPMGHFTLPMVLYVAAPYLSRGCVQIDHGTFQMVLLCPMGHCVFPTVLIILGSHVSCGYVPIDHGTHCVAHGPDLSCITFVPWASTNRPWGISKCSHSVQWDTSSCPWSYFLPTHICLVGVSRWTMGPSQWCFFVPWDTVCCPWSLPFLDHMCPMGMLQWTTGHTVLPMGLTFPVSHVSHGRVPTDHGT